MYRYTVYAPLPSWGMVSGFIHFIVTFNHELGIHLLMLRILHSLPRTHKLLLLPVATMVTVLGTQKLLTTYQDLNQPHTPLESVLVPLPSDSTPGVPSCVKNAPRWQKRSTAPLVPSTQPAKTSPQRTNSHRNR